MCKLFLKLGKNFILLVAVVSISLMSNICQAADTKISREYVESYFSSIAAASCLGVYNAEESMSFNYLELMGWKIDSHVSRSGKLETHFAVASKYFKDFDKTVLMVTFRGSASKMDWKANFQAAKVNYGGNTLTEMEQLTQAPLVKDGPAVHKGFNSYADNVLKDAVVGTDGTLQGVFGYALNNPKTVIIMTGHSMGGAVATLLATRLVDLGFPKERMHVLTFGAPAIGNAVYNTMYANKIDILRITNTNDPVPGSLQTFFSNYVQCGKNIKYHLSSQIANVQHDMAMYFDHSVINLYKQEDLEIAAGRLVPLAKCRIRKGKPLVALWAESSPGLAKMPLMPDLKRMLLEQYVKFLPSYVLLNDHFDAKEDIYKRDAISAAARVGAQYVITCSIDSVRDKGQNDSWHITQEQGVFKSDGTLLSLTSFSNKVTAAAGNVQSAGENCLVAFEELQKHLPFVGAVVEDRIQ